MTLHVSTRDRPLSFVQETAYRPLTDEFALLSGVIDTAHRARSGFNGRRRRQIAVRVHKASSVRNIVARVETTLLPVFPFRPLAHLGRRFYAGRGNEKPERLHRNVNFWSSRPAGLHFYLCDIECVFFWRVLW